MSTTEYRTTVETPGDDQDEHPGRFAQVDEDGGLTICSPDMSIEASYAAGEWVSVTVEAPR